jgi:hypothetical protein
MSQRILEYTDVAGKVVEKVTLTNEEDWRMITIRFTDKTQLAFQLKTRLEAKPELTDWKTGNGKTLNTYPIVRERRFGEF